MDRTGKVCKLGGHGRCNECLAVMRDMIARSRPSGATVHEAHNAMHVIVGACTLGDEARWVEGWRRFVAALRRAYPEHGG